VPEHPPPDQPAKRYPLDGSAVSVTWVPPLYWAVQVAPQSMPMGMLVTVPEPDEVTPSV